MADYNVQYKSGGVAKLIKQIGVIAVIVGGLFLYSTGRLNSIFKGRVQQKVEQVGLAPIAGKAYQKQVVDVNKDPLPSGDELAGKVFLTINTYDWHANITLFYANGAKTTLDNSYFGHEGLLVRLEHQDDTNVTHKTLVEQKAVEWKKSNGKTGGNIAYTIMTNGTVALEEPINQALKKIDSTYSVEGIDLVGKSDGEDQVIAPLTWKTNPEAMRGQVMVCVYDDGDCALGYQYADKVGIPVNFDYHTYNPNGLNVENVDDFIKAGKIFIQHHELAARPVIDDNGKPTGKTTTDLGIHLFAEAVGSWTPVDRNIYVALAKSDPARLKRIGTITSTGAGEERKVMSAVLIVFKPWADAHRDELDKLVYATHKAAMQLDKYPDALQKAMEIASPILGVWDGVEEKDSIKERINAFHGYNAPENPKLHIGGSTGFGIADAMRMLNMDEKGDNLADSTYASVYRTFGDMTVKHFPEKDITVYTPFEKFFNPRHVRAAYERMKSEGLKSVNVPLVATRDFSKDEGAGETIGSTSYAITFRSGSDVLSPAGITTLRAIQDKYAGSEYHLTIVGHADRTGDEATVNLPLSKGRAERAKAFLVSANKKDFPDERISTDGRGSSEPPKGIDPNYKGACDTCRRVEIVISR